MKELKGWHLQLYSFQNGLWNPVKELKVEHVTGDPEGGYVESGEGIESISALDDFPQNLPSWNPVKELKAVEAGRNMLAANMWNPVKELKVLPSNRRS